MTKELEYGGPYADEQDAIDELFRETNAKNRKSKLNNLLNSDAIYSEGASDVIKAYQLKETFEAPVGPFVVNAEPGEGEGKDDNVFPEVEEDIKGGTDSQTTTETTPVQQTSTPSDINSHNLTMPSAGKPEVNLDDL